MENTVEFIWRCRHESVSFIMMTLKPVKNRDGSALYKPHYTYVGHITEEDEQKLHDRYIPKEYWVSCINDPHFSHFTVLGGQEFTCSGKLSDLMLAIQHAVYIRGDAAKPIMLRRMKEFLLGVNVQ